MSAMVRAARSDMKVLGRSNRESEKWIPAVAEALDRILLAQHRMPKGAPAKSRKKPPRRDSRIRETISHHFLSQGYYAVVPPIANVEEEILIADAINDVEEIAQEMQEFLWRSENLGVDDAYWHAHLTIGHWGRHLIGLRSYLHHVMYEW